MKFEELVGGFAIVDQSGEGGEAALLTGDTEIELFTLKEEAGEMLAGFLQVGISFGAIWHNYRVYKMSKLMSSILSNWDFFEKVLFPTDLFPNTGR